MPLGTNRKGEGEGEGEGDVLLTFCGRRGGLMVSALDSGSKGLGSSPGRVIVLCSWATQFTLTVPLSIQEYKWVPANCQRNLTKFWGVTCDGLAILLVASCYGNLDKLPLCGPLGSCADFYVLRASNTI